MANLGLTSNPKIAVVDRAAAAADAAQAAGDYATQQGDAAQAVVDQQNQLIGQAGASAGLADVARIQAEQAAASAAGAVQGAVISRATLTDLNLVTTDPATGAPLAVGRLGEVFGPINPGPYRWTGDTWAVGQTFLPGIIISSDDELWPDYLWVMTEGSGRFLMGALKENGAIQIGTITFASFDDRDYETSILFPRRDANRRLLDGFRKKNGAWLGLIDPTSLAKSTKLANLDPALIYARGGRGIVTDVREDGGFYIYRASGARGAYVMTPKERFTDPASGTTDPRGHMLSQHVIVDITIDNGQSWMTNTFNSMGRYVNDTRFETCHALHTSNNVKGNGPLSNGAGIALGGDIDDITGYVISTTPNGDVSGAKHPLSIGRVAMFARQGWRERYGAPVTPLMHFCHGYPGSTWQTGGNETAIDPATGQPFLVGLQVGGFPWNQGRIIRAAIPAQLAKYGKTGVYSTVRWVDGEGINANLLAMMAAYDAEVTPVRAGGLHFFLQQTNLNIKFDEAWDERATRACYEVARANANGRTWLVPPSYPYRIEDDIHTDAYGTSRIGEWFGYAEYCLYDLPPHLGGGLFNPLWRDASRPMTIEGAWVRVPFARPTGPAFTEEMTLRWNTTEILYPLPAPLTGEPDPMAESGGFRLHRGGVKQVIAEYALDGMDVMLRPASLQVGDQVSYATYGENPVPTGTHQRIWGNLAMESGPGVIDGRPFTAFACPFRENIA